MIRKDKFDAILITRWNEFSCGWIFLLLSKIFNLPLFIEIQGLEIMKGQVSPLWRLALRVMISNCFKIICLGNFQEENVLKMNISKNKIYTTPEGCDYKHFIKTRDLEDIRNKHQLQGKKVILTVGHLVKRKGHDVVIKSLPEVLKKVPDLVYLIVGKPANSNQILRLKRIVNSLGLEKNVIFVGYVSYDDLAKYYQVSDLFVMVSREIDGDLEGFGIVYLEANACGLPVIGGLSGGISHAVLDNKTGLLVNPLDIEAISSSIIELLLDTKLNKKLGNYARERVINELNYEVVSSNIGNYMSNSILNK